MKSGIYALVALDGAPLAPGDQHLLFPAIEPLAVPGCAMMARDAEAGAIDSHCQGDRIDVLLGMLTEPDETVRQLGLDRAPGPAALVAAAHDRWGVDAAVRITGEWLLARWNGKTRTLTLLMSECARDDCYFAVADGRVAVAPTLARLARLPWVDDDFDADALIRTMGRYRYREGLGDRTILNGVRKLQPASSVAISAKGVITGQAAEPAPPPLANISFGEAMTEVEALLRRIMRQHMARTGDAAFLLSGGLDSSLLAWLGAEESRPGQRLHFLSSAAPEGSGIADETGWAQIVADHLGVPLTRVAPIDTDIYAPVPAMFAEREAPTPSPRHYLYHALEQAAVPTGASLLFDGAFGELTVSNHGRFRTPPIKKLRRLVRSAREGVAAVLSGREWKPDEEFQVELAPALRARMTPILAEPEEIFRRVRRGDPLGFEMGWRKAARQGNAAGDPRLRYTFPLRDQRLRALVATFPESFAIHDGAPRAMIRALLQDRLPDRIAQRHCKMPFSPTFAIMLRDQAETARARIAAQREAGAGEWLDLDWLDCSLTDLSNGKKLSLSESFRVQGTAIAGEFFRWWREQTSATD